MSKTVKPSPLDQEQPTSDSADLLYLLSQQFGAVSWVYDCKTKKFCEINFLGETYLGWSKQDWQQLDIWPELIHPDDLDRVISNSYASHKDGKNIDVEYRIQCATSEYIWIRDLSTTSFTNDQKLVRGIFFDVTNFHSAHGFAPDREQQYRKLLDNLTDSFFIEQDDVIVFANPVAHESFADGDASNLVGMNTSEIFCDQHHAKARLNALTVGEQKICTSNETVRSLSGRTFDAEVVSCLTVWRNKPAIQSTVRDLTWLSELLGLLKEERNRGQLILDHIGDGVCLIDQAGIISKMNPAAERILGLTGGAYNNKPVNKVLQLEDSTFVSFVMEWRTSAQSENRVIETSFFRAEDSKSLSLRFESSPIFIGEKLMGAVITIRDLTLQKNSEAEIVKLNRAIEQSLVGIVITDTQGRMNYVNPHFCDMTDVDREDFFGKQSPLFDVANVMPDQHENILDKLNAGEKWEGSFKYSDINGREFWIKGVVSALKDSDNNIISYLGMYLDVTREKQARAAQKFSDTKFHTIFNSIGNAIFIITRSGNIEAANPASCKLFGYEYEEIQNINISKIIPDLNLREINKTIQVQSSGESLIDNVKINRELVGINKNGAQISVILTLAEMPDTTGGTESVSNKQRQTLICGLQDISELKNALIAIDNAQKMDALGELTGGLAHDFNNLLGILIGNLDLAQEEANGQSPMSNYIATSLRAALRGTDLTRNLLDFSRSSTINIQSVDVNSVIHELTNMVETTLTPRIKFKKSLSENLYQTSVNRSELVSSLMNLIFNARDAISNSGEIIISTENFENTEPLSLALGICSPGEYVLIRVMDNGVGMDASVMDKIFEPFFTTKSKGKGTGLGLSTVFGFVQRAGGFIDVVSKLGKGTSIAFFLPRSAEDNFDIDADRNEPVSQTTDKLELLVVDDEIDLAELCLRTLENAGHAVHLAHTGIEALNVLKNNPNISIIVSDIVMPGELDGVDLCEKVAELDSTVKVILTTGYTEKLDSSEAFPKNCHALLRKPFRKSDLLDSISKVVLES